MSEQERREDKNKIVLVFASTARREGASESW